MLQIRSEKACAGGYAAIYAKDRNKKSNKEAAAVIREEMLMTKMILFLKLIN